MKKIILSICLFVAIATVSNAQTPPKKGKKPTPALQQAQPENAAKTTAPATTAPASTAPATTETKPATEAPACCKKKAATCCKKKV